MQLRPAMLDDTAFILDSWCTALSVAYKSKVPREKFKKRVREYIYPLIPKLPILVATNDSREIMGWVAPDFANPQAPLIHFCYVKQKYRRQGVATALVAPAKQAANGIVLTAPWWTPDFKFLRGVEYDPFCLVI